MGGAKYPEVSGYTLIKQVGGGGFSTVYQAVNLDNHRVAACKHILFTSKTSDKEREAVEKEMKIHFKLKHEYVLRFINAVVIEWEQRHMYHPGYYMLLEFAAGGDLFDKIAPDVGVDEDLAHLYFNQLVEGMIYIHSVGVCHRDLKPENLLLDGGGVLKISDFGLSEKFRDRHGTKQLHDQCGSLPYVAPEDSYDAEPIDVWGIGVILFTMLGGNTPWDEPSRHSNEFCRYMTKEIFEEEPWCRFSEDALSLIRALLTINPAKRMKLKEILAHPWCMRPSQLASATPGDLAIRLSQSLYDAGDLQYVAPDVDEDMEVDEDENDDQTMSTMPKSQFTQSLMLFTQTQHGSRYSPNLTRFYAKCSPEQLFSLIRSAVDKLGMKSAERPANDGGVRLRVGGVDQRRVVLKGWVDVEVFVMGDLEGSLCVMSRDEGNPISWRQLWKAVIQHPEVEPHVLRKSRGK